MQNSLHWFRTWSATPLSSRPREHSDRREILAGRLLSLSSPSRCKSGHFLWGEVQLNFLKEPLALHVAIQEDASAIRRKVDVGDVGLDRQCPLAQQPVGLELAGFPVEADGARI